MLRNEKNCHSIVVWTDYRNLLQINKSLSMDFDDIDHTNNEKLIVS